MNRQIRSKKLLVQLIVAQSKFKPYKHEVVCRSKDIRQEAPAAFARDYH